MLFQTLFFWCLLLASLIPILIAGIIFIRQIHTINRFELLFPVGSIFGLSLFVLLLNTTSFFIKGMRGVIFSYLILILISVIIYSKKNLSNIIFPQGRSFYLYITSIILWGVFLIWKGNYALIGSDTNLYFAIAHTFIKGNSPPMTAWQPDLPLAYHLGASELLGAFYGFTNLSFSFLHIFFSCFFIFLTSQIIIWIWKKDINISSFIWGNIAAIIALVSFGFLKIIVPIFPLNLPNIRNLHQLFLWIRNLPTVNQSIEVYGAPINLDSYIYFIFHSFGLALTFSLIVTLLYSSKEKSILTWVILLSGLVSLALINESAFIVSAPALLIGGLLKELQNGTFFKNFKLISLLILIGIGAIIFQGGTITNSILPQKNITKSVLIFPNKSDIKEDFVSYHYNQAISKALPVKQEWLPFRWFHIGVDLLVLCSLICLTFIKLTKEQRLLTLLLFLSGLFSLLAYHLIVPKFLIANGNRFLAFSFLFLSLSIIFSLQDLALSLTKRILTKGLVLTVIIFFVIFPTILPPLFLLSKNRSGENKLVPKNEQKTLAINWIEKNIPYDQRIIVLDVRSPHPSGQARAMVQAGVFAPLFPSDFKAYTIEASPQYFDIVYFLSPQALTKLKIDLLLIDDAFFETLPDKRKQQLSEDKYFEKIFDNSNNLTNWEKIYRVKNDYLINGTELQGTFTKLTKVLGEKGKIYIDNEENFHPSFLRRPIIFSLRDKDIYYLPESGVYLNVEADINSHPPREDGDYDYLVLSKNTNPEDICQCQVKLLWRGLKDEVLVWKKI